MSLIQIRVPDIGDFDKVPVIEVLVAVGDTISVDQSLLTLESDKATMEVPSSHAGVVKAIHVKEGDELGEGDLVLDVEAEGAAAASEPEQAATQAEPKAAPKTATPAPQAATASGKQADISCQVVVIGAGPGGYTAAFRAADLGLDVVLVDRNETLGGVCLNVGCIPSKALLHAAKVIDEAAHGKDIGVTFGKPKIDLDKIRGFKENTIGSLTKGLAGMAKQRKVRVVQAGATFLSPNELSLTGKDGEQVLAFEHAIIAAGSEAVHLPFLPWDDDRVMDSTGALELKDVPKKLLVVGGGIIGLEMATVYDALGSEVTVVEFADQVIPGADADLVKPLLGRIKKRYKGIHTGCKLTELIAKKDGLHATFEGKSQPETTKFDRVLVAVGRTPNGGKLDADKAGVNVSDRGFVPVDGQMRTNVPHIFAIGDIVGQPMLAHKATHEAKVAAEVIAGHKVAFEARVIPSVAYTDPEISWVGITEKEAKEKGIAVDVGKFPYAASGRAIGMARTEGFTKLIFDPKTERIIGGGIVGPTAGDMISEVALAIEMGAHVSDIGLTIHPHPTLGETIGMAAEVYEGTVTDLYIPKKK